MLGAKGRPQLGFAYDAAACRLLHHRFKAGIIIGRDGQRGGTLFAPEGPPSSTILTHVADGDEHSVNDIAARLGVTRTVLFEGLVAMATQL